MPASPRTSAPRLSRQAIRNIRRSLIKDGDNIVGAAPTLVETIAKQINVPLESKYMGTWEDAQAAARDGKADMIFGIYYNDERATYLDYIQPAFTFDDVAVLSSRARSSPSPTRMI